MKQSILALVLICTFLTPIAGQQSAVPASTPQKPSPENEDVVRITTNLVQIDAVVTDRRGQHIDDLRPEEFEVFEDGRPQQISNFTYVSVQPESKAQNTVTTAADKTHPRPPSTSPEQCADPSRL